MTGDITDDITLQTSYARALVNAIRVDHLENNDSSHNVGLLHLLEERLDLIDAIAEGKGVAGAVVEMGRKRKA